jgi:DNA-binding GntR family transcriptional regulator
MSKPGPHLRLHRPSLCAIPFPKLGSGSEFASGKFARNDREAALSTKHDPSDDANLAAEMPAVEDEPTAAKVDEPQALKREPGYDRLQQLLREDILTGRIPEGSRLKVSDITARYDTSTNPAREALQGLEGEGLVVITPNRGARVRAVDEDFVRNIFDLRGLIEPYLVRDFAEFATADEIEELTALQQACDDAVQASDYPRFHIANVAFHDFIIERHHNLEAIRIMKQHSAWIRSLSRKNPLTLAHMRRSNAEHWQIVEAVKHGDPAAAVSAISRHVENSRTVFLAHMRRDRVRGDA